MISRQSFWSYAAVVLALAGAVAIGAYFNSEPVKAQTPLPTNAVLQGYAWSSNIGWIKMSSEPSDSGSFGVRINENGYLDGYAWSPHVGWLEFDEDFSERPGAKLTSNGIEGWARFCSALPSGCTGTWASNEKNGGWDGWLSFDGDNYGVTANGDQLGGYAWGSENVGWVDFSGVTIAEGFIANCEVIFNPADNSALWRAFASGGSGNYSILWESDDDRLDGYEITDDNPIKLITLSYANPPYNQGTFTGRATITDGETNKTATCQANLTVGDTEGDHVLRITIEGSGQVEDGLGNVLCQSEEGADGSTETMCNIPGFTDGEEIDLEAVPFADVQFFGWIEGDCSGSDPVCNLIMDDDKSVTAKFQEQKKFEIASIKYASGNSMQVNYQIHELDQPHQSTKAIITLKRLVPDWTGEINLALAIPALENTIVNDESGNPVVAGMVVGSSNEQVGPAPLSVFMDQDLEEIEIYIKFATDGESRTGIVSPYADNYSFMLTATAVGSVDDTYILNFSYLDFRESEN